MATIKSYTDIEQSRKLAEILPQESSDMWWLYVTSQGKHIAMMYEEPDPHYIGRMESYGIKDAAIRCWSLAALLGVLPSRLFDSTPKRKELYLLPDLDKSYCFYRQFAVKTKGKIHLLTEGECLVDACYEMILKLNELKLL